MLFLKRIIVLLFMLLMLISCVTTKPIGPIVPRITVIDNFLKADILITEASSILNSSGFIEVQVTGINKTAFYKQLEYRVEWLDRNGLKISTIMSRWTTFPAYENSEFRFKAVAPKTTASDYRILIRKGGD